MLASVRRFLTRPSLFKEPNFDGVHLSVVNHLGSVQHYYHFMMGFVVPLIHIWPEVVAKAAGRPDLCAQLCSDGPYPKCAQT